MKTFLAAVVVCCSLVAWAVAGDRVEKSAPDQAAAERPAGFSGRGYELLTTKAFMPPDFDQETFDNLWQSWEEPQRSQAESATVDERRAMAFARYGLTSAPGDPPGKPQQYVIDAAGNWTMNCLACHQGKVAGQVVPGMPNTQFALQSLADDVRTTKMRLKKRLVRMDLSSAVFPLGTSHGTTNAVMFGVALMAYRDPQLNVVAGLPSRMVHHDHDAPAWWNFRRKSRLYADGFAEKGHRPLMQFMLTPENGPDKFQEWEADFQDVYAWLSSLEAPKYPFAVDKALAAQGEAVFKRNCADCHGSYGDDASYPNKIVSIEEVGTDPVRLSSLTKHHRAGYEASWFSHFGEHKVVADPGGYVAPPLNGIWASAPYFHNGSVPSLWHVLHPAERPAVWTRTPDGYDQQKVGVEATAHERVPADIKSGHERRRYFDTAGFGKSAAGHDFPDALDEGEKRAVLEYLKTL